MIRMVERKQKGKSILTYILIPFCALIIVEAFVFIGILVLSGIRGQMEKNAYDIVKERVSTRKTDLQSDMLVSWTDIDELQIYINETVSKLSDEGKINLEHMDDDSEAAEPLLSAVADNMVNTLRTRHVNSIFLILNTSDLQECSNKPGLYILDQDSDSAPSRRNQDLLIQRGSPAMVKKLGISTSVNWKPNFVFDTDERYPDYIYKPSVANVKGEYINSRNLGYWSMETTITGDTEQTLTYSIPLRTTSGKLYGVLGVGILESHLREKLPKSEIHEPGKGYYCIAVRQNQGNHYRIMYSSDNRVDYGTEISLSERQKKYFMPENSEHMYVSAKKLSLYNHNTPYESEQWYLIGMVPEENLMAFANGIYLTLLIAILLMVIIGVMGGIAVSLQITNPIKKLYVYMEHSSAKKQENIPKTNINEIDHLITNIETLNQRLNQDKSHIIMGLTRDYLNVFLVHPSEDIARVIKLEGQMTEGISIDSRESYSFQKMADTYISTYVYEKDQKKMRYILSAEGIDKNLADSDEYNLSYQVLEHGEICYYQVKIIKAPQNGQYIIGFQNIDSLMREEKRKQKLYEQALEESQKANVAKTNFLSRMSHDIRTPINGIVGMTHIMETESDNHERVMDSIQKVKMLSGQLELLINDVLEMSRIESGNISLSHEAFHLSEKLQEIIPAIQVMAEERGVILKGTHFDITHFIVIGSPVHVQRIMMNILSNAIKYNRTGGTVEYWLSEVPMDDNHSKFMFKVQDTGIGMSQDFISRIYEPFSREQTTPDTTYTGTGLGMAITKELLERMGGSIVIESEQGMGTTVSIAIPFEIASEVPKSKTELPPISLAGKRILLVEDNELNLEIAKYILQNEDVLVDEASNGQKAVEIFETCEPDCYDIILMDVMMPVMNGLDATRAIRNLSRPDARTVPIIAMTANAFEEDIEKCIGAGMNDHIAKPIDIKAMKSTIAKYL